MHMVSLHPTSELLLPVHLIKEVLCSEEEVVDLAALLVSLGGIVHSQLWLWGQELTDVGDREYYLLHGAILTYNLNRETHRHLIWASVLAHMAKCVTISQQTYSEYVFFFCLIFCDKGCVLWPLSEQCAWHRTPRPHLPLRWPPLASTSWTALYYDVPTVWRRHSQQVWACHKNSAWIMSMFWVHTEQRVIS